MSKLKMLKFEAAALQKNGKAIIEALQKLGDVELEKVEDERLFVSSTAETVSRYEKYVDTVVSAMDILVEYRVKVSKGMFSGRDELSDKEYGEKASHAKEYLGVAYKINELKKSIVDSTAEIAKLKVSRDSLKVWEKLDIPMSVSETKSSKVFIGSFSKLYDKEGLVTVLSEILQGEKLFDCEIVYSSKEITSVVLVCSKNIEKEFTAALRSVGFAFVSDSTSKDVSARLKEIDETIDNLTVTIDKSEKEILSLAERLDDLKFVHDYLKVKADEYSAVSKVAFSGKTVIVKGYLAEKRCEAVKDTIEKLGGAVVFSEPDEDEDVPVILSNGPFCEPVEGIAEMYSLPGKKDFDPAPIMAFFYYLLFGMMLSDAGYGLVMTIGTWFILKKTNVEGSMRKTLKMFFYCGISTIFWGALFGSWFGDIIPVICTQFLGYETAPNIALWFEPIKDPITLLLFSFVIGICHLFIGLIALGVMKWREGDKVSAICDTIPIMLTVLGAAPLAASILAPNIPSVVMEIAKYVAIVGVVLIVLTSSRSSKNILSRLAGGLYGLYNIASGYLSDILSYSRLLALGLATGSIASVINMMGTMVSNPVVKVIVLVVVFIVGHILNMAINVLGAYVHTNRLQFVELFSKFYEGGGRPFRPLKFDTKYYKLKEEKQND